ncbi:translation factor waclaw, mitochondrial-like [Diachasma alloeum]|uniref:translation factor waclaw, mitochondrial-like n=1 Tax=Diachasma alloeum TaxID=454923 RepID=UPI000738432B|nr:translation factor waclaw, mitochondrial-like [Diachasma alloeum]
MSLCMEKRGLEQSAKHLDNDRIILHFILPLSEIIIDFHDALKSMSSGYASFDYEDHGYVTTHLVKLSVLLNGLSIEELSTIVHTSRAKDVAKHMARKLGKIIPRQQFLLAIQIGVGAKILAREDVKPYRKDITSRLVISLTMILMIDLMVMNWTNEEY